MLLSASALAEGLLGDAVSTIPAEELQTLQLEIDNARLEHPNHFNAVHNLVGEAGALDQRKRGRMAPFSAMFKRLGAPAHMALVELLLFKGPSQGELKDSAWFALRAGAIEAAGRSRDTRLTPALNAYLNGAETEFYAIRAAAEALGKIGTDEAAKALISASEANPLKRGAIVAGMGYCRRAATADYLAGQLENSTSEEMTDTLIKALRDVGNAYAWKTSTVQRYASEEASVRRTAAKALFEHYVTTPDGLLRDRSLKGLVVINHEDTRAWTQERLADENFETRPALERLQSRLR